jgi:hypothetical protein
MSDAPNGPITVTIEQVFGADANRLLTAVERLAAGDATLGFKAAKLVNLVLMD